MGETFPLLDAPGEPVPWAFVEPHREQAFKNHGQTLERLAQRGGLSQAELVAIIEKRCWSTIGRDEIEAAPRKLAALLLQFGA